MLLAVTGPVGHNDLLENTEQGYTNSPSVSISPLRLVVKVDGANRDDAGPKHILILLHEEPLPCLQAGQQAVSCLTPSERTAVSHAASLYHPTLRQSILDAIEHAADAANLLLTVHARLRGPGLEWKARGDDIYLTGCGAALPRERYDDDSLFYFDGFRPRFSTEGSPTEVAGYLQRVYGDRINTRELYMHPLLRVERYLSDAVGQAPKYSQDALHIRLGDVIATFLIKKYAYGTLYLHLEGPSLSRCTDIFYRLLQTASRWAPYATVVAHARTPTGAYCLERHNVTGLDSAAIRRLSHLFQSADIALDKYALKEEETNKEKDMNGTNTDNTGGASAQPVGSAKDTKPSQAHESPEVKDFAARMWAHLKARYGDNLAESVKRASTREFVKLATHSFAKLFARGDEKLEQQARAMLDSQLGRAGVGMFLNVLLRNTVLRITDEERGFLQMAADELEREAGALLIGEAFGALMVPLQQVLHSVSATVAQVTENVPKDPPQLPEGNHLGAVMQDTKERVTETRLPHNAARRVPASTATVHR